MPAPESPTPQPATPQPSAPAWQPVLAEHRHIPGILALYQTVWGRPIAEDELRWKLFDGPYGPLASVAMIEERCVGLYAVIPTPLLLDGAPVMGAQSVDTMTHPQFRRQNMSATLARHCYAEATRRGYAIVYGVPNENSYPMFMSKLGWRHLDTMTRLARPLAAPRAVPRLLAPLADGLIAAQVRLSGATAPVHLDRVGRGTHFVPPPPVGGSARCRVHHTPEWLAWRYGAEPGASHERLVLGPQTVPEALAVFDMALDDNDPAGRPLLRISLLLGAPETRARAAGALLRLGLERGARSAIFVSSDPQTHALLRPLGFRPREGMPLAFGALARPMEHLPDRAGEMAFEGGDRD